MAGRDFLNPGLYTHYSTCYTTVCGGAYARPAGFFERMELEMKLINRINETNKRITTIHEIIDFVFYVGIVGGIFTMVILSLKAKYVP
jgi:hypothetical protein